MMWRWPLSLTNNYRDKQDNCERLSYDEPNAGPYGPTCTKSPKPEKDAAQGPQGLPKHVLETYGDLQRMIWGVLMSKGSACVIL